MKTKILVIGNGSSIREHTFGKKIDSDFDVVVRFNRGYFEGIKGYEDSVGSKTNALIGSLSYRAAYSGRYVSKYNARP